MSPGTSTANAIGSGSQPAARAAAVKWEGFADLGGYRAMKQRVPQWRRQYTTFGDLFRERYSSGVERLAVLLMVPTSVLWAAAQIRAARLTPTPTYPSEWT